MKKIALTILLITIGLSSFAKHSRQKRNPPRSNKIESVSMSRTACYGRCPVYTIEITKSGLATYNAQMFNADTGIFQKNIGAKTALQLFDQMNADRIDTCKDLYPTRVQDLPGVVYTITYKDSLKTIRNANLGPYFLKQLSASIDSIGKKTDDSWKKLPAPRNTK
jgi:hypothetical protein